MFAHVLWAVKTPRARVEFCESHRGSASVLPPRAREPISVVRRHPQ
jgi:hypothetical protein